MTSITTAGVLLDELGARCGNALLEGTYGSMNDGKRLAQALNLLVKSSQFSYKKARAAARQEPAVDWEQTKRLNEDFNEDVDGCESFVMRDGSVCEWQSGQFKYAGR